MNIRVQSIVRGETTIILLLHFWFFFFLSQFLFSAYMGYVSKQKDVMRDVMVFVMEACSFANFQKN